MPIAPATVDTLKLFVVAPIIELSRTTIAFPTLVAGNSADSTLVISNAGNDTLQVDSVKVTTGANNFSVVSPPTFPVKVDTSATTDDNITLTVRFDPIEDGALAGTLTIYSNTYGGPDTTVALTGTGIVPKPTITLSPPDTLDFGSAKVGETVLDSVIIKNTGEADLYVTGLDTTVGGGQFVVQSPAVPDTVETGGADSLVVVLAFMPAAGGLRAGELEIISNDLTSPDTVALTGTGTVPTISVEPAAQNAPLLWKAGADAGLPMGPGVAVVDVTIEDAVNVTGWDVGLNFDATVLEYVDAVAGPFLPAGFNVNDTNAANGQIFLHATGGGPASGAGTLARVLVRTKKDGSSVMDVFLAQVAQPGTGEFPVGGEDGAVQVDSTYFANVNTETGKQDTIDAFDVQLVAGRFAETVALNVDVSQTEMAALFRADIDASERVRINDVQVVAGRWNMEIPAAAKMVPSSALLVAQIVGNGTVVKAGETVWVEVFAEDAIALGAFQFDLKFDQSAFEVSKVVLGDLLGSTGNSAVGLGPVTDDGTVRFGAYTMGGNPGASGAGVLARVQVVAKADGEIDLALADLMATDVLGNPLPITVLSAVEDLVVSTLPDRFALTQNYPNPFNPETTIHYDVPASAGTDLQVRVEVFDVLGQVVRTLVDAPNAPGSYEVTWDAKNQTGTEVSAGVYFCRMVAGDFEMTRKMVLLK